MEGGDVQRRKASGRAPLRFFGDKRTAEEVTNGIDLTGKVAVVTGCTSGIGRETMRVLALRGAHVIGTGRNKEKAELACRDVGGRVTPAVLELSDPTSVLRCADELRRRLDTVDLLVCNAGTLAPAKLEKVDGIEKTFATNHLGHFLLVNRLLPHVLSAEAGRVVVVSSDVAYRRWLRNIDFDALRGAGRYSHMRVYAQSKLANALFSKQLARRLRGTRAVSNAVNPGFVRTNIENKAPPVLKWMMKLAAPVAAKSAARGAATTCYVGTDPRLEGVSGEFFEDCTALVFDADHPLNDDALAAELWTVSEELLSRLGSAPSSS